jgi:hypothetical protein
LYSLPRSCSLRSDSHGGHVACTEAASAVLATRACRVTTPVALTAVTAAVTAVDRNLTIQASVTVTAVTTSVGVPAIAFARSHLGAPVALLQTVISLSAPTSHQRAVGRAKTHERLSAKAYLTTICRRLRSKMRSHLTRISAVTILACFARAVLTCSAATEPKEDYLSFPSRPQACN